MSKQQLFWRVGYAPYTLIPGPIFEDKAQCVARAKQENRYGEYRGRGCKPYAVDAEGRIAPEEVAKEQAKADRAAARAARKATKGASS